MPAHRQYASQSEGEAGQKVVAGKKGLLQVRKGVRSEEVAGLKRQQVDHYTTRFWKLVRVREFGGLDLLKTARALIEANEDAPVRRD